MFVALALFLAAPLALATTNVPWYSGYQVMLNQVNAFRQANGKPNVCISSKLMTSSYTHSAYQANLDVMTHDENGQPFINRFRAVNMTGTAFAENVAQTWSFNVTQVMQLWMNSPGKQEVF